MTDLDRVGGEGRVHTLMRDFISRVAHDFIIGFLFEGRDLERIALHESELAAAHLGGGGSYRGRPLRVIHQRLRINRGQFRRRLAILRTVLVEHEVPDEVIRRWLAHDAALEAVITDGTDCAPPSAERSDRGSEGR